MQNTASVNWTGSFKQGQGQITTESGALRELPYSYATRFTDQVGTNPEELIASAHASCFTMAFAAILEKRGFTPTTLHTDATVTLQQEKSSWSVSQIHLRTAGHAEKATAEEFEEAATEAKENCPISRLLNTEITLETEFVAEGDATRRAPSFRSSDSASTQSIH